MVKGALFGARGEGFAGRVAGGVGGGDADTILAIGEGGGIPGEVALGDLFLKQFPLGLVGPLDFDGEQERIAVGVCGGPADSCKALGGLHRGGVVQTERVGGRGPLAEGGKHEGLRRGGERNRRGGETVVGRGSFDLIDAGRHVLREIGDIDRIERCGAGERGLPLQEAGGGRGDAAGVRGGPRAPAFLGLIEIAAARGEGDGSAALRRSGGPTR